MTMTREELLARYATGEWDFRSVDLLRAYLTWADPDWADLGLTNLTGTSLTRANLTEANLYEAGLAEAKTAGSKIYGTLLYEGAATKVKVCLQTPSSPVWGQPRIPDALSGSRVVNGWLRTGYASGEGNGGER